MEEKEAEKTFNEIKFSYLVFWFVVSLNDFKPYIMDKISKILYWLINIKIFDINNKLQGPM